MLINPAAAGIKHQEWRGAPEATWHSENQLPTKEYLMKRVMRGHLIDVFYDTEANHKNADLAQFKSFFAIQIDLAGRKIGQLETESAFAPHHGIGFIPALIGGFSVADMERGWPAPIFTAVIYDFLRSCVRLDPIKLGLQYDEELKAYPFGIPCAGGENITIHLHEDGTRFRLPEESPAGKWRKVYGFFHPYNGEKYDDTALAKTLSREGFPDLFPTFVKRNSALRSDVLGLMRLLAVFGDQRAQGIKTKSRFHRALSILAPSFRLGDMVAMNDLHALRERGVQDGARDYLGRVYDPAGAHQADRDVGMTAALYYLARYTQPEMVDWFDQMADRDAYNNFLHNPHGGMGQSRVFGLLRRQNGQYTGSFGTLIGLDSEERDWRRGVIADLQTDPRQWLDSSDAEQQEMIRQGRGALLSVRLNRAPNVVPQEWAERAGYAVPNRQDLAQRSQLIHAREEGKRRVLANSAATYAIPVPDPRTVPDPTYAAYGTLGDIEKYRISAPSGRWELEPPDSYHRRKMTFARLRDLSTAINEITRPPRILFEDTPEALTAYQVAMARGDKRLEHLQTNWHRRITRPEVAIQPEDQLTAAQHFFLTLWQWRGVRFTPTKTAHIVNGQGQRVSWSHFLNLPSQPRKALYPRHEDRIRPNQIRFQFEGRDGLFPTIIMTRIFTFDDWIQRNPDAISPAFRSWWRKDYMPRWEPFRARYQAMVAMMTVGPPGVSPSEHAHPTAVRELEVAREWLAQPDKRLTQHPHERELMAGLARHYEEKIALHPVTTPKLLVSGYDGSTKMPVQRVTHLIRPDRTETITIPNRLLEHGVFHDWRIWPAAAFMLVRRLPKHLAQKLSSDHKKIPSRLLLESTETGRQRLFADALVQPMPPSGSALREKLEFVAEAYRLTGRRVAADSTQFSFITGFDLLPISNTAAVDESVQSASLDAQNWNALIDPVAGALPKSFSPITGIVVRHVVGQNFKAGKAIRLRRMEAGEETGDEFTGKLKFAEIISLDDLRRMSDPKAQKFGALTAQSLHSRWAAYFAHHHVPTAEQKLWRLKLASPVQQSTYRYFQPEQHPLVSLPRRYERMAAKIVNSNMKKLGGLAA